MKQQDLYNKEVLKTTQALINEEFESFNELSNKANAVVGMIWGKFNKGYLIIPENQVLPKNYGWIMPLILTGYIQGDYVSFPLVWNKRDTEWDTIYLRLKSVFQQFTNEIELYTTKDKNITGYTAKVPIELLDSCCQACTNLLFKYEFYCSMLGLDTSHLENEPIHLN